MATAFLALVGFIAVGMALVVFGTIAKNRWGINLAEVSCPRCNKLLPKVRPESRKQALWGGCTCPNCGAEVDKWGREVPTARVRYWEQPFRFPDKPGVASSDARSGGIANQSRDRTVSAAS